MKREKIHKTNAMRQLEAAGIAYETASYVVDENDLSGMHVASQLKQDPARLFKTLVLVGEHTGYLVCCIPTACELDLKKVARAAGDKRVELLPLRELRDVTGYVRGGCSPLAMKKQFPTFIDETAILFDSIYLSAGERGEQIIVNAESLAALLKAPLVDLCL
ncbi:ybaK/ebsC protein [Cryptobacterium curtum DSM 15641]|uniref:Cys-tRNA(Pro)/Cys-tRNA(Cys) deacylase n=2 Tax=Cryptobacterium TaxID=84162 RepID=C7MP19_CRYCD|nr:Cys-tRNA(Pro) deacylase [Cryptobacterium curtum]ACU94659.1 ybaK/ebsC protein [Cryptobacterium curtum DSM 15641]